MNASRVFECGSAVEADLQVGLSASGSRGRPSACGRHVVEADLQVGLSGWVKAALLAAAISAATSLGAGQERSRFEVATIKPAAPNAVPRNQIVPTSPNRIYIPSMTLSWLIYTAHGD